MTNNVMVCIPVELRAEAKSLQINMSALFRETLAKEVERLKAKKKGVVC